MGGISMTLEEAIKHCEQKACDNSECALEHRQLAKWLKQLQTLLRSNKAIEERAKEEMQEAKLVVYPYAIKHAFLKCGKEGKVIHEMYGNEFDSITPNRIKYLSFLKKVELDNRFDELNEVLNKYGK